MTTTKLNVDNFEQSTGAFQALEWLADRVQEDPDFVLTGALSGEAIQEILAEGHSQLGSEAHKQDRFLPPPTSDAWLN